MKSNRLVLVLSALAIAIFVALSMGAAQTNARKQSVRFLKSTTTNECIAFVKQPKDSLDLELEDEYYSSDCINFNKLIAGSSAGDGVGAKQEFRDPRTGMELEWYWLPNKITMNGKTFLPARIDPTTAKFHDYPEERVINGFYRTKGGQYVLMTSNRYDDSGYAYKSVRIFVGTPGRMVTIPVKEVSSYCHGWSYKVLTAEGTLDTTGKQVTWAGQPVEALDPDDFEIVHTAASVALKQKSAKIIAHAAPGGC